MKDIIQIKCEVCGRPQTKKRFWADKKVVCKKHYNQFKKFGKFLDNNPRCTKDLNDYVIKDDIAIFNLYNQYSQKVGEFIVDANDVEKIKYKKWRLDTCGRIVTITKYAHSSQLSRYLLDMLDKDRKQVVDHIDGNPMNNRRSNLRITTQQMNLLNKSNVRSNSGFKGVRETDRGYEVEITLNRICYKFKRWHKLEEAVYARYVAETILFKEFRNNVNDDVIFAQINKLSTQRKKEIETYVIDKINSVQSIGE